MAPSGAAGPRDRASAVADGVADGAAAVVVVVVAVAGGGGGWRDADGEASAEG